MSPDWSAKEEPVPYAKLDDPQSLNLYSYVQNNPLSRTDADGHCTVEGKDHGWFWCAAHWAGLIQTPHEQAEALRTFYKGVTYTPQGGKPTEISKMSDADLLQFNKDHRDAMGAVHWAMAGGAVGFGLNVQKTLESIDTTGKNLANQAGGQPFQNRDGLLPSSDANGNPITYKEWDTEPSKQLGQARTDQRILTGSDGSAWLTNDHYKSFTQIR